MLLNLKFKGYFLTIPKYMKNNQKSGKVCVEPSPFCTLKKKIVFYENNFVNNFRRFNILDDKSANNNYLMKVKE